MRAWRFQTERYAGGANAGRNTKRMVPGMKKSASTIRAHPYSTRAAKAMRAASGECWSLMSS